MVIIDYDYSREEDSDISGYIVHLSAYVILRNMDKYYKLELEDWEIGGLTIGYEYDIDTDDSRLILIDIHDYYNNGV